MKKYLKTTTQKIEALFFLLAFILLARLFVLTVLESEDWTNQANNLSIRGLYTAAPRGQIYDRNGKLLAGSTQIFSVKMSTTDMTDEEINNVASNLVNLFEKNGDTYENNFPIKYANGKYSYTYNEEITSWLTENEIDTNATAEEALYTLKERYGIETSDRYEIQSQLQEKYSIYPPILVKNMEYSATKEKTEFLEGYSLDTDLSAEKAFKSLRKKLKISNTLSEEQAIKIMAVRNELKSTGYRKYISVTLAKDISDDTVMEIEEMSNNFEGVEISSETKRYYPNGNSASHILGYLGKISSDEKSEYEAKGYDTSSLIGKEGIEKEFESILKGQDGTKIIKVNSSGEYVDTVSEIEAKKGKDVYLTIDSDLQKVAEDALEKNISLMRQGGGTFTSEWGNVNVQSATKAASGALVAIEVETGDVLAMASYPDFDPNLFVDGISSENWASLQSSNPYDSLAASPLYNLATRSAVQPGSTFKPITALAALDSGLSPSTYYQDKGYIEIGGKKFGCAIWNKNGGNHGSLNLYSGMENSCNYYFWDLATNKNWATGSSLGLSSDMGIEKILKYAKKMGLGSSTGVELDETVVKIPSLEKKLSGLKNTLSNWLYANAEEYFEKSVYSNSKKLKKDIEEILTWLEVDNMTYKAMKNDYLPKVGIKESKYSEFIQEVLYTYCNQNSLTVGDALNISIGQGDNAYTPLQMASYIATLGNDGQRNQVSIVKSIEDEGNTEKKKTEDTGISKDDINVVKDAMHQVSLGGGSGLKSTFSRFSWDVCAKTGTAQKSGYISTMSEVDYIKSHLSSFGNMSWSEVETEMDRLMKEYSNIYTTEDTAVRRAVINLSGGKLTSESLDRFKDTYDDFAWIVAMAPKDDPKIAIACFVPQGGSGYYLGPAVREVIGSYLKTVDPSYENDFKIVNEFN